MRVKLNGKYWTLKFARLTDELGRCESPDAVSKTIYIDKNLRGEPLLNILVHEMLHACCWPLDETTVAVMAEDMARVLWRLGYRRLAELEGDENE